VKTACDPINNVSSEWSTIQNFTTKPLRLEEENDKEETSFEVFPNPVSSLATILFSLNKDSKVLIELFSIDRRKVITIADENFQAGNQEINFDCRSIPAGWYSIQLRTDQAVITRNLVIE